MPSSSMPSLSRKIVGGVSSSSSLAKAPHREDEDDVEQRLVVVHRHSTGVPRRVLSEEEYSERLSDVVSRAYFPALPSLRREVELLRAREAGDVAAAVAARRAARAAAEAEAAAPPPESLDAFHARHTSEDNEAFEEAQRRDASRRRASLERLFSRNARGETPAPPSVVAHRTEDGLASDLFDRTPLAGLAADARDGGGERARERCALFFTPTHVGTSANESSSAPLLESGDGASRRRSLEATDRSSMPPPPPRDVVLRDDPDRRVRVQPSQTRLPCQSATFPSAHVAASTKNDDDDDDEPSPHLPVAATTDDDDTDLDAPLRPLVDERAARRDGLRNERRTLLDMTPLVLPGESGGGGDDEDDEPIVTWGDVAATPLVLGGARTAFSDDHGKRERAADELLHDRRRRRRRRERRSDEGRRGRAAAADGTASVVDRVASLTPAARSLLARATKTNRGGGGSVIGSLLSSSSSRGGSATPVVVSARDGGAFGSVLRESYGGGVGGARRRARSASRTPVERRRGSEQRQKGTKTKHPSSINSRAGVVVDDALAATTDGLLRLAK